jgi:hypothetical protein
MPCWTFRVHLASLEENDKDDDEALWGFVEELDDAVRRIGFDDDVVVMPAVVLGLLLLLLLVLPRPPLLSRAREPRLLDDCSRLSMVWRLFHTTAHQKGRRTEETNDHLQSIQP